MNVVVTGAASMPAALAGLRVLDLSGAMGNYAGKLFADMGADVILVEPPGGTELRREPPFIADEPGIERSLDFAYQNTSKRGICLDLDTASGQRLLRDLAATADLVIETAPPGWMAARGVGYEDLARVRPQIVVASITPFGQTGPYAQMRATDLVGLAMGGLLYMGGYRDAAPTQAHGDQALKCAAMYGAVAAMLAVTEAELTGQGQHVDISMQESVTLALENAAQTYDLEGAIRKRPLGDQRFAGYGLFECKDGYIFLGSRGIGNSPAWTRSLQWFKDEGMEGVDRLFGPEWSDLEYLKGDEAREVFGELFHALVAPAHQGLAVQRGSEASDSACARQHAGRSAGQSAAAGARAFRRIHASAAEAGGQDAWSAVRAVAHAVADTAPCANARPAHRRSARGDRHCEGRSVAPVLRRSRSVSAKVLQ